MRHDNYTAVRHRHGGRDTGDAVHHAELLMIPGILFVTALVVLAAIIASWFEPEGHGLEIVIRRDL